MARKADESPDRQFIRRVLIVLGLTSLVILAWQLRTLILMFFGAIVVATMFRALADHVEKITGCRPGLAIVVSIVSILALAVGFGISRLGLSLISSVVAGAVFGAIVYYVDFYGFTSIFPWFAMARGSISLFSHAMFGAVAGGVYQAIAGSSEAAPKPAET